MTAPDLDALLAQSAPNQNARKFPPEVAKARKKEQMRRSSKAQALARTALTKLHPDDFRSLYLQASAKVDAEAGPLPGDDEVTS